MISINLKRIYNSLRNRLLGINPEESNRQWLLSHGLRCGIHVDCFSWGGIDAQYPGLITIGNYVTIASGVRLLAHDAAIGYLTKSTRVGIISIGDHCFIGAGSIILPNVRIGDWSIVGAGSLVTKDIPAGCVCAGNPAKILCTTKEYQEKHEKGLHSLPVSHKPWRDWANASDEEWEEFRKKLADTFGYVSSRIDL
jgi:maltose O-acetyltransferase